MTEADRAQVNETFRILGRLGVTRFVLAPGARNAVLIAAAESLGAEVRRWRAFDERTGAFFALGLSRADEDGLTAVITTSGTAVAELLPAAVEAHYARVPFVVVTADRPVVARDRGVPQGIDQSGILGKYARYFEVGTGASDFDPGDPLSPVLHLNVPLDEPNAPLSVGREAAEAWGSEKTERAGGEPWHAEACEAAEFLAAASSPLLVVGPLLLAQRQAVAEFCRALGVPVLAEASSSLCRAGLERISAASYRIADACPDRILRLGGVPTGRFWRDLETMPEIDVFSLASNGMPGLVRESRVTQFPVNPCADPLPELPAIPARLDLTRSDAFGQKIEQALAEYPLSEPALIARLSAAVPKHASVFLGNSLVIREWEFAAHRDDLSYHSNRGANGIDGEVATWLGSCAGDGTSSWGVFGELTALYDANALGLLEQLEPRERRMVVINNGGGRIFDRLPALAGAGASADTMRNAVAADFAALAKVWGAAHQCWDGQGDVPCPLESGEFELLEVLPDEDETEAFWNALKA